MDVLALLAPLREPLQALVDPAQRIFLPFVFASMGLVWLLMGLRGGTAALVQGLVSRRIWGHGSARADVVMMFAKAVLGTVLRIPWLAATAAASLWVAMLLHDSVGPAEPTSWSRTGIAIVYSLILFVAWDFSRFALHWLMHRVPLLWTFHQVHHSAEVLTPLTLYRVHPVETILYDLRGMLTTAAVTGVFLYAFAGAAVELEILGVNALGFLFNALGANLRHSHVWLRFGKLERWLLSPAQHQLHHGRDVAQQQSNYGTWIALWDRLAGSWRPAPRTSIDRFGVEGANHRFDSVASMLLGPMVEAFAGFARRRWVRVLPILWFWGSSTVRAAGPAAPEPSAPTETPAQPDSPRAIDPIEPPAWPTQNESESESESDPSPETETPTQPDTEEGDVDFELELPEDTADQAGPESQEAEDAPVQADATLPARTPDLELADIALDRISIVGLPQGWGEIGGSAHVIDEEELERKEYDDIHRVLRTVPGVYLREEDAFGLRPNIGMRGASSDRSAKVTLMEDGILLGPAPYSAPAAYYFPLVTRMAGVEVFKGPAAIRYGPNTIGGAINMLTRPVPPDFTGFIDASVGMRGYGKVHGWWGGSYKGWGLLLEGARIQSNGFKEIDGGGDSGFDKNELMLKVQWASDPNRRWYHQVGAKGGFANERSLETYLGLTQTDFESDPYRRYASTQQGRMTWWRTQAEASYFVARGTVFDLQIRGYRHDFDRAWRKFNNFRGADVRQVIAAPDVGQTGAFYQVLSGQTDSVTPDQALLIGTNDRRFQVNGGQIVTHWRPTWRKLEQDIEVGVRVHHDQVVRHHTEDPYVMLNGMLVPESTMDDTTTIARNRGAAVAAAFHALDTMRIEWFSVMPGARVEIIRTEFEDRLADTDSSDLNAVFIPGIGLHARANDWLTFLAGVHSGFSPVAPGQPDEVQAERSINYEAGARADHAGKKNHVRAEVIGFFNDYSNLTSVCTFSTGCDDVQLDRQFNAGHVFVYGVESLLGDRVQLPREHFVEGSISYTYTGSNFRTSFTSANPLFGDVQRGDALPYVPVHMGALNLGVGGKIWGIYGSTVYVGEMRDVAGQGDVPEEERIPRHYVVDLTGQVSPTRRATIYLNIHNLTNNAYMVSRRPFGARPGMPFQLMAGFKYQF